MQVSAAKMTEKRLSAARGAGLRRQQRSVARVRSFTPDRPAQGVIWLVCLQTGALVGTCAPPAPALTSQFSNLFPHSLRLRRIGVPPKKTAQLFNRGRTIPEPEINLRQRQLRMREMGGVQLNRDLQILFRSFGIAETEVRQPELRIRQSVVGPSRYRALVVAERLLWPVQIQQHSSQIH